MKRSTGAEAAIADSATPESPLDIFSDPAKLALPPTYSTPTQEVLLRLAVKRPPKQSFFRVHPGEDLRQHVSLLQHGEGRDMYLVVPGLYPELVNLAQPYVLYFYVTRDKTSGLWPVRLPGPDGRTNAWWDTAHAAAEHAMENWVRLESDALAGSYRIVTPSTEGIIPDPQWPNRSLSEILRLGFQNRVIDSVEHIIIKQLRGEA